MLRRRREVKSDAYTVKEHDGIADNARNQQVRPYDMSRTTRRSTQMLTQLLLASHPGFTRG